ncbi:hypothetical protein SESBI_14303 [Sesbania bispinosa]|nr:hypothetical protein SESBI_14303 [Sesbania bispinosa]
MVENQGQVVDLLSQARRSREEHDGAILNQQEAFQGQQNMTVKEANADSTRSPRCRRYCKLAPPHHYNKREDHIAAEKMPP